MIVYGIDPGYEMSAVVVWDGKLILDSGYQSNDTMLEYLRYERTLAGPRILVIEQIESFGMAVGKTVFETVFQSGRFAEAWFPKMVDRVPRRVIKLHLCGQARATDSNIRQALIDRFGPSTEKAIGKKASQGPLYGITSHKLAALAVALTWADQHPNVPVGEIVRPGVMADF